MAFTIDILRSGNKGTLKFQSGDVSVNTTCWWAADVRIDAGIYTGAATRMTNKNDGSGGGKRQAIYLGEGVKYNHGTKTSDGIFIHKGTGPSWSEGCIVIVEFELMKIWTCINPKDAYIVTIGVSDEQTELA
jgi:hypothetical protein